MSELISENESAGHHLAVSTLTLESERPAPASLDGRGADPTGGSCDMQLWRVQSHAPSPALDKVRAASSGSPLS